VKLQLEKVAEIMGGRNCAGAVLVHEGIPRHGRGEIVDPGADLAALDF